jgi:hypothetical protein
MCNFRRTCRAGGRALSLPLALGVPRRRRAEREQIRKGTCMCCASVFALSTILSIDPENKKQGADNSLSLSLRRPCGALFSQLPPLLWRCAVLLFIPPQHIISLSSARVLKRIRRGKDDNNTSAQWLREPHLRAAHFIFKFVYAKPRIMHPCSLARSQRLDDLHNTK